MNNRFGTKELLIGAAISALLVGGATAFMNTKQGRKFKRNLRDRYSDIREKIEDFVEDVSENVNSKSGNISGRAKEAVQNVMEEVESLVNNEKDGLKAGLVIGGLVGGLLGAGGALLLTANYATHENGTVLKNLITHASNWKEFINDALEKADEGADAFKNGVRRQKSKVNDVIDLALAGVQLWQNARRRAYAHR